MAGLTYSWVHTYGGFAAVGDTLYFTMADTIAGSEIWKTDGTVAGTVRVTDKPGS